MTTESTKENGHETAKDGISDSEAFLESLIDSIPTPIFYKDRKGRFIGCNRSFEDLYGVRRREITGKNAFDITAPNLAKIYRNIDNEIVKSGKSRRFESQIRDKHGELRDVIAHKAALKDDAGNITGIIGTLIDITERNRVEKEQQRLNRELHAMSRCRQAMIRATDEESLINDICHIICDEGGYRMAWVGYVEHDEAKTIRPIAWHGKNSGYMEQARLSWSEDSELGRGPAGEAARSGQSFYVEDIATDARMGPWREAALERGYRSSLGAPIKDENGKVIALLSVYSDKTFAFTEEAVRLIEGLASDMSFGISVLRTRAERTSAEAALRESEEKYRGLFNNSPLGLFRSSLDGHFIDVNPALARMLGYDSPESLIRDVNDIGNQLYIHPEDRQQIISRQLAAADDILQYTNHYRRKDGSECIAHLYLKTVRDKDGRPLFLEGITEDITAQRREEEERKRLEDQLAQAQKMESIGRLAGGIAHDFNNMLGVIIGYAELSLRKVPQEQKLHHHLQEIRKAAQSSANLTRQLLTFARKQTITPSPLDLNEAMDGICTMLQRLIGEDITLISLPETEVWRVKMDPSQIDQILANLCVNARDAIDGVGRVTIQTKNIALDEAFCTGHTDAVAGDYVRLSVNDNGCGMDQETLDNAFEPFFTTKEVGKGTGLGLATVYGIVKQNNGFIDIESRQQNGTTITIYLPRYSGEVKQTGKINQGTPVAHGHETILIVEDEPAILDMMILILKRCGYRTLAASTPAEGIRISQEHGEEIQLLITDIIMPGMNGYDLAKAICSLRPQVRRLFMSGYSDNLIANQELLDEDIQFIQKPFSVQTLATKVRRILDEQ